MTNCQNILNKISSNVSSTSMKVWQPGHGPSPEKICHYVTHLIHFRGTRKKGTAIAGRREGCWLYQILDWKSLSPCFILFFVFFFSLLKESNWNFASFYFNVEHLVKLMVRLFFRENLPSFYLFAACPSSKIEYPFVFHSAVTGGQQKKLVSFWTCFFRRLV